MSVQIFIIPFMFSPVCFVHMPVEKKSGMIFFNQFQECLKSLMGKIPSVIQLISRRVGDQDIESAAAQKLEPQSADPSPASVLRYTDSFPAGNA